MSGKHKKSENSENREKEEVAQEVEIKDVKEAEVLEKPDELSVMKDMLARQAAEYDNYRKRTARERMELVPEITAKIVSEFLPVIDNIERALNAECSDENYKKGVEMVYSSFVETLKKLDVSEIAETDFDPALHQAVQHVEHDTLESGKVAQVFQKGYKIGGKVIRYAMVSIVK